MKLNNPTNAQATPYPCILASASNVDANALATTTLAWIGTHSAANSYPQFVKITRKTGTFLLLVLNINLGASLLRANAAVTMALLGAGSSPLLLPLSSDTASLAVSISAASNYSAIVATINGSSSTFDLEIWGLRIS